MAADFIKMTMRFITRESQVSGLVEGVLVLLLERHLPHHQVAPLTLGEARGAGALLSHLSRQVRLRVSCEKSQFSCCLILVIGQDERKSECSSMRCIIGNVSADVYSNTARPRPILYY